MTTVSSVEYEQQWESNEQLRQDLNHVRTILIECSKVFAQVAGVPSLIHPMRKQRTTHNAILKQEICLAG